MNYQHLFYFWTVATEGNLTRGAKKLKVSPSAVSTQIRWLEESLGNDLFERRGRELVLTDFGKNILLTAEEIFRLGSQIETIASQAKTEKPWTYRIGVGDNVPKRAVLAIITALQNTLSKACPRLVFTQERSERVMTEFELGQLDLMVIDDSFPNDRGIKPAGKLTIEAPILFFVPTGLLSKTLESFPKSLNKIPFFLPTIGTRMRTLLDNWFEGKEIHPNILMEFNDTAMLRTLGQKAQVVFPATTLVREYLETHFDLKSISIDEHISEEYHIYYNQRTAKTFDFDMVAIEMQKTNKEIRP